jgi:hypothetical protein
MFKTRKEYEKFCRESNDEFIQPLRNMGRMVTYEYARKPVASFASGRGEPYGHLLAWEDSKGTLFYGWSAANPGYVCPRTGKVLSRADKFSKPIGLKKAISRSLMQEPPLPPPRMYLAFKEFVRRTQLELKEKKNDRLAAVAG